MFWLRTSLLSSHTVVRKPIPDHVIPLTELPILSSELIRSFRNLRTIIRGAVNVSMVLLDAFVLEPQNLLQAT